MRVKQRIGQCHFIADTQLTINLAQVGAQSGVKTGAVEFIADRLRSVHDPVTGMFHAGRLPEYLRPKVGKVRPGGRRQQAADDAGIQRGIVEGCARRHVRLRLFGVGAPAVIEGDQSVVVHFGQLRITAELIALFPVNAGAYAEHLLNRHSIVAGASHGR